jgi:hypothetical protein
LIRHGALFGINLERAQRTLEAQRTPATTR